MLCYAASPNRYFDDHACDLRGLYDGFYFVCGSWDAGVASCLGVDGTPATNGEWFPLACRNIAALCRERITENLLGVSFGGGEPWPSPETLLSDEWTAKMGKHFGALGRAAKCAGFRGVSIDLEYPFPRYELDNPIYPYEGYTPGDLMAAAYHQARVSMAAILDEFPEAVVFLLPGGIRTRPIERQFMLGLIDEMAERDALGGCHLASEYSYRLHDPVTQASIPRFDECRMGIFASEPAMAYWKRRCTVAPGVWALHKAEAEAIDYPVRPWSEEMEERRLQMRILRSLAKRYVWSYSSYAAWYVPRDGMAPIPGVRHPDFPHAAEAIALWHDVLRDRTLYDELPTADRRMLRLFEAIREFDAGRRTPEELCDAFGTPATWSVLGPLGDPHHAPMRTADEALERPIDARHVYCGRDGAVRWFMWPSQDPRGIVNTRSVFDFIAADDMSFHMVAWIHSDREREGQLHLGWHDGLIVRLGNAIVLSRPDYPPGERTGFCRDRYQFDERIPVRVPKGATRLAATIIAAKKSWRFAIRLTDRDGYPFDGVRFSLSADG